MAAKKKTTKKSKKPTKAASKPHKAKKPTKAAIHRYSKHFVRIALERDEDKELPAAQQPPAPGSGRA